MRLAALLSAAAAALLAGCGGVAERLGGSEAEAAPAAPVLTADGEALAPEVFQVSAEGLWDGRPSLGGVWVAHPDATSPERVLIALAGDDAEVTGALFRREGEAAGPPIQISSQAAAALGLAPGQAAPLTVTALRRPEEAAAEDPASPPAAGAEAAGTDAPTEPASDPDAEFP